MLSFRHAALDDSAHLLRWRNDLLTRSMSLNTDIVAPAVHDKWLTASLANPDRIMVIAEEINEHSDRLQIAIIRFDLSHETAIAAINLDAAVRGRGLATPLLLGAEKFLPDGRVLTLIAEIKTNNIASRRAFERAGYQTRAVDQAKPSSATTRLYKIWPTTVS